MKAIIAFGAQGIGKTGWLAKHHPESLYAEDFKHFVEICRDTDEDVTVDTNAFTVHTIAGYVQVAQAYGFDVEMVMLRTTRPTDEKAAGTYDAQRWTLENRLLNNWPTVWGDLKVADTSDQRKEGAE